MGYRIRTDVFEGPLDLLLHLVSRQKLDIGEVSLAEVADQYLEHLERMRELDLEVASDFLLVAATLLELKASRLIPADRAVEDDEFDDMSPEEARRLLVTRLLTYKQFKNVAGELAARMEAEAHQHPRAAALEERYSHLMPDFLEGVTLHQLSLICSEMERRRRVFLLEAEHVAARPVSVDHYIDVLQERLAVDRRISFGRLITDAEDDAEIVGLFLAMLEMYKRGEVDMAQDDVFGDISVVAA